MTNEPHESNESIQSFDRKYQEQILEIFQKILEPTQDTSAHVLEKIELLLNDACDESDERYVQYLEELLLDCRDEESDSLKQFGPFQILELLGEGGMGKVYLARKEGPGNDRRCALKVMKKNFGSENTVARFQQEQQILNRMNHPNIATLYDFGMFDEQPWISMEYVSGMPITHFCNSRTLRVEERLNLFLQTCAAVEHAHQRGVLHRDIKPDNVLVCDQEYGFVVKVIDFGIARFLFDSSVTHRAAHTLAGRILGTPDYMSPEQLRGESQMIDTRTDVYSLGILFFELLTGTVRFIPSTSRQIPIIEKIHGLLQGETPLPSQRAARLGKDAPVPVVTLKGELDWISEKAMAPRPDERYGSVGALSADIQRYLDQLPIEAGPRFPLYGFRKFVKRHRTGVLTGTALALFFLVAGITYVQRLVQVRILKERALEAEQQLVVLEKHLKESSYGHSSPVGRTKNLQILAQVTARLDREMELFPLVKARAQERLFRLYRDQGDLVSAGAHLDAALALRRKLSGPNHLDTLKLEGHRGEMLTDQHQFGQAEAWFRNLLVRIQTDSTEGKRLQLWIRRELSELLLRSGRSQAALNDLPRLIKEYQSVFGAQHPEPFITWRHAGNIYRARNQGNRAKDAYQRSLEGLVAFFGAHHPEVLTTEENHAILLFDQGHYSEAETCFKNLLQKWAQKLVPTHPAVLRTECRLGLTYARQKKWVLAKDVLGAVLVLQEASLPDDNDDLQVTRESMAFLLDEMGQTMSAAALQEKVIAVYSQRGPDHAKTLRAMINQADHYRKLGRLHQAELLARTVLSRRKARHETGHPRVLTAQCTLAEILMAQRRYQESLLLLQSVVASSIDAFRPSHPNFGLFRLILGRNMRLLGDYEGAEDLLNESLYYLSPTAYVDQARQELFELDCMSR